MKRLGLSLIILSALAVACGGEDMFQIRKSSGNAIVPGGAPIQPPQAFVNASAAIISTFGSATGGDPLNISNLAITSIDSGFLEAFAELQNSNAGAGGFNLSANALTVSTVNAILSAMVDSGLGSGFVLDLSGGTNAAPTGQGLTDKATLIDNGWTVTTN